MKHEQFDNVLNQRIALTKDVLSTKAKEYSTNQDRLWNFKRAGELQGITPEKALIGMLSKHLVSVIDMVNDLDTGIEHVRSVWDEKIGDSINYLILLESLVIDGSQANNFTESIK